MHNSYVLHHEIIPKTEQIQKHVEFETPGRILIIKQPFFQKHSCEYHLSFFKDM